MTVSLKSVGAITLFVEDLQRSRLFYQDAFGLQAIHEDEDSAVFEFENTIINLLRVPAARVWGAKTRSACPSRRQPEFWHPTRGTSKRADRARASSFLPRLAQTVGVGTPVGSPSARSTSTGKYSFAL